MYSIEKVQFPPLSVDGTNYLAWTLDIKAHLEAKGLIETITTDTSTLKENAQALVFIKHHLKSTLKAQHLHLNNPKQIWEDINSRFDHQKLIFLPRARQEWANIRVQDFKTVALYNSELF
jgi:hypothetical protein